MDCFHRDMHRLQITFDDDRFDRVAAVATARNASMASVIRDAIDVVLDGPEKAEAEWRFRADELRGRLPTPRPFGVAQ